jgi:hypothetical protein
MVLPEFMSHLLPGNKGSMAFRQFQMQIDKTHFLQIIEYLFAVTRFPQLTVGTLLILFSFDI